MNKKKHYPTVLSIAGSDSGGGAGIQADIKTISALGCYAMTAVTTLTAQNTIGVQEIYEVSPEFVSRQILSILSDIKTNAIKIGMLYNKEIVEVVYKCLVKKKIPIILDPVMVATSGDLLVNNDATEIFIQKMIPLCEIITPNIHEAGILANLKVTSIEEMKIAATKIAALGAKHVLVKGGDRKSNLAIDILYNSKEKKFNYFEKKMIKTINTHGTGCSLSSAISAYRAHGADILQSIQLSKDYIHEAINAGKNYQLGKGNGPIDHFWNFRKKS